MAGIVSDIFSPLIFAESAIGDIEGIISDIEGAISAIEGGIADFASILGDMISMAAFVFNSFWTVIFWIILVIVGLDSIILLQKAEQEYYDITDNIANVGIYLDTLFDKTLKDFFTKYLPSGWNCMTKMIRNFPGCIAYYIIDAIGQILYLPFRIVFWIFCLSDFERMMWDFLRSLDDNIKSTFGFHLLHYPDSIIQDCYTCNLEPMPVFHKLPPMKTEDVPGLIPIPFIS